MELKLLRSHQCHHKPVKKNKKQEKRFNTLSVVFLTKTCSELLNIARKDVHSVVRIRTLSSRELEMHSQAVVQM